MAWINKKGTFIYHKFFFVCEASTYAKIKTDLNYATGGSNLLASLTSELADSAARRYLRRIRFAGRATGGKSLLLQKAEKDSHECDCLFLAEGVKRKTTWGR